MQSVWLFVLIISLALLLAIGFKIKPSFRWVGYVVMNIALAAVILYLINVSGFAPFRLPINEATVLTVGILGIPGLLLLIALKLTVF